MLLKSTLSLKITLALFFTSRRKHALFGTHACGILKMALMGVAVPTQQNVPARLLPSSEVVAKLGWIMTVRFVLTQAWHVAYSWHNRFRKEDVRGRQLERCYQMVKGSTRCLGTLVVLEGGDKLCAGEQAVEAGAGTRMERAGKMVAKAVMLKVSLASRHSDSVVEGRQSSLLAGDLGRQDGKLRVMAEDRNATRLAMKVVKFYAHLCKGPCQVWIRSGRMQLRTSRTSFPETQGRQGGLQWQHKNVRLCAKGICFKHIYIEKKKAMKSGTFVVPQHKRAGVVAGARLGVGGTTRALVATATAVRTTTATRRDEKQALHCESSSIASTAGQ
jgi:hypothetical protein